MFVFNIVLFMFFFGKLFGKMKMCAVHRIRSPHMNTKIHSFNESTDRKCENVEIKF